MKFIHTADLHIGKVVNGFSMEQEQACALEQIFRLAMEEQADALLLAGDIYDRAIPPKGGVELFDRFLGKCTEAGLLVLAIAGNHDSPERLEFGRVPLSRQGIWLCGRPGQVSVPDGWGEVTFHLLPFAGPARMGELFGSPCRSLEEGVRLAVSGMETGDGGRHVLVTHHFAGWEGEKPETTGAETMVGGADLVDASLFRAFDYTALGHIHGARQVGGGNVYYSGSPVKYSFAEAGQRKSVYLVELREKGNLKVERKYLEPLHDMRVIRGPLRELISPQVAAACDREDYICARLTDEGELYHPAEELRAVYPNLMQVILEKNLPPQEAQAFSGAVSEDRKPEELFADFYLEATGREPGEGQKRVAAQLFLRAGREEP